MPLNLDIYRYNTGTIYIIPINSQIFIIPLIIITDKLMQHKEQEHSLADVTACHLCGFR